jgi:hypothetical protein
MLRNFVFDSASLIGRTESPARDRMVRVRSFMSKSVLGLLVRVGLVGEVESRFLVSWLSY